MNNRDRIVIFWMALLFVVSWSFSLGRLINTKFWDPYYVLSSFNATDTDPTFFGSSTFSEINETYYTYRYLYLFPHVVGAIIWWNLYFIQLFPQIRKRYRPFHRYLGRFLMVAALSQIITGFGLGCTALTSTIKIVSSILCIATLYCLVKAWYFAANGDIPRHKYWAMRLVGYMQTIALQRFWMVVLLVSYQIFGWHGLYPPVVEGETTLEERNKLASELFDNSFILCILHAVLMTEWYLAGEYGWDGDDTQKAKAQAASTSDDDNTQSTSAAAATISTIGTKKSKQRSENRPLLSG